MNKCDEEQSEEKVSDLTWQNSVHVVSERGQATTRGLSCTAILTINYHMTVNNDEEFEG